MLLSRSWRESLTLFIPKNFKLFLLATAKSALDVYGFLAYYYWWLILAFIAVHMSCYYPECSLRGVTWLGIEILVTLALYFVVVVLARPSLPPKNYSYVKQQAVKSAVGFFCIFSFFWLLRYYALGVLRYHSSNWLSILNKISIPQFIVFYIYLFLDYVHFYAPLLVLPPVLFSLFFFLDSHGSLPEIGCSMWRGLKMFFFNLPFCLLSIVVSFLLWVGCVKLLGFYGDYLFFSFIPFLVSYFKNMYVKRLHDQFNLYFVA